MSAEQRMTVEQFQSFLTRLCDDVIAWRQQAEEVERERDQYQELARELARALEWACEEGGWRLWYHSFTPLPEILEEVAIGKPARIKEPERTAVRALLSEEQRQTWREWTYGDLHCIDSSLTRAVAAHLTEAERERDQYRELARGLAAVLTRFASADSWHTRLTRDGEDKYWVWSAIRNPMDYASEPLTDEVRALLAESGEEAGGAADG